MSERAKVAPNQCNVNPGGGNRYVLSSLVKAYSRMISNGKCKNTNAPPAAILSVQDGLEFTMRLLEIAV
jgi:hypothetical protein